MNDGRGARGGPAYPAIARCRRPPDGHDAGGGRQRRPQCAVPPGRRPLVRDVRFARPQKTRLPTPRASSKRLTRREFGRGRPRRGDWLARRASARGYEWSGKLFGCPNEMVPLQIDLVTGEDGTCRCARRTQASGNRSGSGRNCRAVFPTYIRTAGIACGFGCVHRSGRLRWPPAADPAGQRRRYLVSDTVAVPGSGLACSSKSATGWRASCAFWSSAPESVG
jgi:hypothetical protein